MVFKQLGLCHKPDLAASSFENCCDKERVYDGTVIAANNDRPLRGHIFKPAVGQMKRKLGKRLQEVQQKKICLHFVRSKSRFRRASIRSIKALLAARNSWPEPFSIPSSAGLTSSP